MSHPRVPGRAEVMRAIVEAHNDAVLQGARDKYGSRLAGCGLLDAAVAAVATGAGWSPPFGAFEAAVRGGDEDAVVAGAARLAVWAHDHGVAGSWRTELRAPAWLRIGDAAAVQLVAIDVDAALDGYEFRGRTSSGERIELRIVPGTAGDAAPGLGSTAFAGRPVRLSTATDLAAIPGAEFLEDDVWKLSDDLPRAISELAAAERLLREHGPDFCDWVEGVVRQVLFTNPGPGLLESGSSRLVPGFIHVAHGEPLAMAEMLTHELSHQYYYLATRLGPVDDGTDEELYWSPVKQTGRPIANILLAYHAFGNVLLLMRGLLVDGVTPTAPIESNAEELAGQLIELQRGLDATVALTEVGRGLYEPLRDALELNATER
jgi:hypothetical protein